MPIDRRVTRTRGMLHQALFSLIMERGYDVISITDICERADVGRTTFYAHYSSKDELKRTGLDHLRKTLRARHEAALADEDDGGRTILDFSLPMFEHARDHLDLYRALIGSKGGAIALDTIREIIADLVRREIADDREPGDDAMPREFTVQYVVGAFMAVLGWWLDEGAKLPVASVAASFRRLATDGLNRHRADRRSV